MKETNVHTLRLERDKALKELKYYRSKIGNSIFGDSLAKELIENREELISTIDEMLEKNSKVAEMKL